LNLSSTLHHQPSFGIVYKKSTNQFTVHTGSRVVACGLSTRLRKAFEDQAKKSPHRIDPSELVTVGDEVHFIETPDGAGMIVEVLPRRSKLARRSPTAMPSAASFEQVIVANVDQVVPVFAAAQPEPHWNLLDRYLVTAEAASLPAVVIVTKTDLIQTGTLDAEVDEYRRIGYPVILASAVTGQGLDEVRAAFQGRRSVLLGKSGVGKSSLLNALQPGLGLRVNAVSQITNKGRHTTTHLEMFPLEWGGAIVDTPGVREFGLWGIHPQDLALYFPEMRPLVGQCRFGLDCAHDDEPGCAVRRAVMTNQISPRRYQSYMKLKEEL